MASEATTRTKIDTGFDTTTSGSAPAEWPSLSPENRAQVERLGRVIGFPTTVVRPTPKPAVATEDEVVDVLAQTSAQYLAFLSSSLTPTAAADRLGLSVHAVRRMLTARPRRLYGTRLPSGWRIPTFQFDGDRLLPGLPEVVAKISPDLHPLGVHRWFTLPDPDLVDEADDDLPMSPREWLLRGFPPAQVASLAGYLGQVP